MTRAFSPSCDRSIAVALDLHDQGAEVGAPVADVVVADQVGSAEIEQSSDGLADHHWAQVADVCLLGGISTRVVDDDFAAVLELFGAALVVLFRGEGELPLPDELRRERKIDEAGASDVERDECRVKFVGGFCGGDQAGSQFAGIEPCCAWQRRARHLPDSRRNADQQGARRAQTPRPKPSVCAAIVDSALSIALDGLNQTFMGAEQNPERSASSSAFGNFLLF